MNRDDRDKEKKMTWERKKGWRSDDSDDEDVIFNRFKKFYNYDLEQQHDGQTFAQKRDLEPFEVLMLEKLGGNQIIKDIFKKNVDQFEKVYQWVDPSRNKNTFGDLLANNEQFEENYPQEQAK